MSRAPRSVALAAVTASAAAVVTRRVVARRPPGGAARWERRNHRGEPVSLLEGVSVVVGTAAGALLVPVPPRGRAALAVAALGAGAVGAYDDLTGATSSKGLRGHLGALRRGEVTSGSVKILALGATGVAAAALAAPGGAGGTPRRAADALLGGAVVAAWANLVNLLDLRPGRAAKVVVLHAPLLVLGGTPARGGLAGVAAPVGAALAALPEDLGERGMLGDTGANALGAALGTAVVAASTPPVRLALLGGLAGLTLASERVSFTAVIEATPVLRTLDRLGRRPA